MAELRDQLQATLGDTYTLENELPGGGMSRVFVAHETALGRKVVVKVLPSEMAAGLNMERFRREIQVAAQLQHPHIVPLLSSGETAGLPYFTMPYVRGESLRARLASHGELPVTEAVRMLREVASAIAYAHDNNVVHRDIKPENVLISSGSAMVTDFGVAKALTASAVKGEAAPPTSAGVALGTPAYMAPEQATGDPSVDNRADIYALGIMAYEMLAGTTPFVGRSQQAMLAAQVMEPPEDITRRRPTIPPALASLVMRMIEKRPADRPQSAHDITDALDALSTPGGGLVPTAAMPAAKAVAEQQPAPRGTFRRYGVVVGLIALVAIGVGITQAVKWRRAASGDAASIPTIAVLPFENLGNAEGQYFTDGIGEEITNRLASLHGLRVIGRQSVKAYAAANKPAQQIATELGVKFILTGTVRWDKAADGKDIVRVSPALLRGNDGTQVWSRAYQTVLSGIFDVQSKVATEVADALDLTLLSPDKAAVAARPTDNVEAYSYYLRGNDLLSRSFDNASQRQAIEFFDKAVKADPQFALAYAATSFAHTELYWGNGDVSQHRLELAKAAADRALEIDPKLPEAHFALAIYYYHGFNDYTNALRELAIAERGRPNDYRIPLYQGSIKRRQGKFLESLADLKRAADMEPRYATLLTQVAASEHHLGRYADAERTEDRGIALEPTDGAMPMFKVFTVIAARGDVPTAVRTLRELYAAAPRSIETMLTLYECAWPAVTDPVLRSAMLSAKWTPDFGSKGDFMLLSARIHEMLGDSVQARAYADSATVAYSSDIRERPTAAEYYRGLAVAEAKRGRMTAAFAALDRADGLRAASQDAYLAPSHLVARAEVLMLSGDYDGAVTILEKVLSGPSDWSPIMVRLDPMFARLRGNPRFQKLVGQ